MKKNVIFFLKFLFLIIILAYLIQNKFIDLNLFTQFTIKPTTLTLIFLLIFISILVAALRWSIIIRLMKFNIELKKVLEITYISCFFNSIFLGGFGGDFLRAYYIYNSSKTNKIKLSFSVLIDRFIGFVGLFLIVIFFVESFIIYDFNLILKQIAFLLLMLFILINLLLFILKNYRQNLYKKIINKEFFFTIKENISKILFTIILSVILFLAINFSMYLISSSIYNYELNLDSIFLSNSVSIVFNTLSLTPGGIGVGEVVFSKIIEIVSNEDVKGIANIYVFWRIIYLIFCLPALFFFLFYKPKVYKFKKTRNF